MRCPGLQSNDVKKRSEEENFYLLPVLPNPPVYTLVFP